MLLCIHGTMFENPLKRSHFEFSRQKWKVKVTSVTSVDFWIWKWDFFELFSIAVKCFQETWEKFWHPLHLIIKWNVASFGKKVLISSLCVQSLEGLNTNNIISAMKKVFSSPSSFSSKKIAFHQSSSYSKSSSSVKWRKEERKCISCIY